MLVTVENDNATLVDNRNNRFGEVPVLPGVSGFLLGLYSESVNIFSAETFKRGNKVSANTLGHEAGMHVGMRVHSPGATIRAHRHAGHRLNATGNNQILPARADFHGCQIYGLKAGSTESVEGNAGYFFIPICSKCGCFSNVGALIANGRDATKHYIVYLRSVQVISLLQRIEHSR